MNPWLEHPSLWGDVHFRLISALARYLSPLVSPRYYVSVGSQAYIATAFVSPSTLRYPDVAPVRSQQPEASHAHTTQTITAMPGVEPITVEIPVPDVIEETYLEIREAATGQVITVIEVLSPTNKRPGVGRQKYERKRLEILSTHTHLIEIDLLRVWMPMPTVGELIASDYRILVRRGEQGNQATLYAFNLRDPIPVFHLPLQVEDVEPIVGLKELLDDIYIEANYDIRIDYRQLPEPPLSTEDAEWARDVLRSKGKV
jgi:hypothetical protein